MTCDDGELDDDRIADWGGWHSLTDLSEAPDRTGVYVSANRAGHVKYVAKAGPGRLRQEAYNALYRVKGAGAGMYLMVGNQLGCIRMVFGAGSYRRI